MLHTLHVSICVHFLYYDAFCRDDKVQSLFDFVDAHATEEEELPPGATMSLVSNFPTKHYTNGELSLAAAGMERNTVLRVAES